MPLINNNRINSDWQFCCARPLIVAVEHLLSLAFPATLALRLSRPFEQTPPQGAAVTLRLVFGTDNCINAISAPKHGSSTATLGHTRSSRHKRI